MPLNRRHLDGILLGECIHMNGILLHPLTYMSTRARYEPRTALAQDWRGMTAAFSSVAHLQSPIDSEACTKAEHSTLVSPLEVIDPTTLQRKPYRIYTGAEGKRFPLPPTPSTRKVALATSRLASPCLVLQIRTTRLLYFPSRCACLTSVP